jgi:hypothetical protein
MTSQKIRDTSSAIMRAMCARVCAGRRYGLLLRKKRCYMGSLFFIRQSCRTVEQIYRCLGSRYFRRAYCLSYESFLFLHEKLSVGIAEAIDNLRPYKRRGGRGCIESRHEERQHQNRPESDTSQATSDTSESSTGWARDYPSWTAYFPSLRQC